MDSYHVTRALARVIHLNSAGSAPPGALHSHFGGVSMDLSRRAENAAKNVFAALGVEPSEAQAREVSEIIERAFSRTVRDHSELCAKVALKFSGAAPRTAEDIAEDIRESASALIANLSSLR